MREQKFRAAVGGTAAEEQNALQGLPNMPETATDLDLPDPGYPRDAMNAYSRSLEQNAARDIFQIALDDVSIGAFVLGESGLLLFANHAGQKLLDDRAWLRLERGRLAVARSAVGSAQVGSAIKQLVAQGICFTREVRFRGERVVLVGGPVSEQHALASRIRALGLIWILTMKPSAEAIRLAAQLYRLTTAEQRMLGALSEGHDLARITKLLGVKQTTLRTQLRSIFTKTGCRRQSELLVLVSRLSLFARAAARRYFHSHGG